jgi:hypothetical protein
MKLYQIQDIRKNVYDFAHFFNIHENEDGTRVFNINRTLYIAGGDDMLPSIYNEYMVKYGDSWTNISFQQYGTIELWWIICKFNDIIDPTSLPIEGTILKIPTREVINIIIDSIKKG